MDLFVDPEYRGLRLGRRLYEARKELCQNLNLKAIIAGGRIPNFQKFADKMSPKEYIEQVKKKEIFDPILTFQLSNDFEVKRLLKASLCPTTLASMGYATLLQWNNIYYEPKKSPLIGATRTTARVGLVQWQMRTVKSVEEMVQQFEYFVDALSTVPVRRGTVPGIL